MEGADGEERRCLPTDVDDIIPGLRRKWDVPGLGLEINQAEDLEESGKKDLTKNGNDVLDRDEASHGSFWNDLCIRLRPPHHHRNRGRDPKVNEQKLLVRQIGLVLEKGNGIRDFWVSWIMGNYGI